LRDATTLATRVGEAPEWVAAAALLTMLALGLRGGRGERAGGPGVPDTTKDEDDDDAA
jgi:apolipoprotein N-acyltransferase